MLQMVVDRVTHGLWVAKFGGRWAGPFSTDIAAQEFVDGYMVSRGLAPRGRWCSDVTRSQCPRFARWYSDCAQLSLWSSPALLEFALRHNSS